MNKYQWFAGAGVFFLLATVFANWTALTAFSQPDTVIWAVSRMYAVATWFCYGITAVCTLAGLLEGQGEKRR